MRKTPVLVFLALSLLLGPTRIASTQTNPGNVHPAPDKKKPKIISLKPGEPVGLPYDAGIVRHLATSDDTNGAWSLVELMEMPGYKTRYHRHLYTDEAYYVLEGVLTAKIADKTYELPAGSYVLIPHGTPHAQGNLGKVPVRVLLTMTPAGFERSFTDRAELMKTVKPSDPDFRQKREEMTIKQKYDREFISDWNPEK